MGKKMGVRLVSMVLAVVMIALLFTGCGARDKKERADSISVYLWSVKRALYGKFTVAISLKPAQLVGYESVGKTERCTCEFKSGINISVSFR